MASTRRQRDGNGSGGLSLPEDVVFDVLVRLPAKALCRFRCVSKAWRALISDPAFVAAQRSHAGPLIAAVFRSTTTTDRHEVRLLDKDGDVLRVFDVRGTVALLAPTRLGLIFIDRSQLGDMIIDPASGRSSMVVGTDNPYMGGLGSSTMALLSDDYSFGRASPSGDYKVLRIVVVAPIRPRSYYGGYSESCAVATVMDGGSEEPTWRQRPWPPFRTSTSCEHKATVNGVLYFMPLVMGSCGWNRIAAFDLESEEWKPEKIKGPRLGRMKDTVKWSIILAELKGTLCLVQNVRHLTSSGDHDTNVWLLMDPSRGIWVKQYTIQMLAERLLFSMKPLDVLGDGTTLLLLNTFWKAGNINDYHHRYILQFYNLSTETFTDFMEMAEGFNGRIAFYTGSLLS